MISTLNMCVSLVLEMCHDIQVLCSYFPTLNLVQKDVGLFIQLLISFVDNQNKL